ncbi:MAG: hypothetical protein KDC85_03055 [Saprospiraceae bacterium]|nr:hypothetical protein [Saprospiraceae bacterium]MCB9324716.1 hypothetical protein [Lewinellaceae bacterium]
MKNINFMLIFALILLQTSVFAQSEPVDSTGLPGDNFSLEGALEMFKISSSPEDFEKRLNEEDNDVNNLDLNEDGEIDYIRVEDKMEGNVHVLILQVPVNENEVQDIAVIEIEKTGEETAILQIEGDEDLYGPEVYAEPFEAEAEMDGKGGPSADIAVYRIVVNVWVWPSVRYIYAPNYVVWVSPYGWRVYPTWWRPWRPHPWRWHYNRCTRYHAHYRVVHTHRVVNAHRVYAPHRRTSVTVKQRTTTVGVKKTKNGAVVTKKTTTRGAVKNPDGNVKAGKKTTTTKTAVKKGDGTVKAGKRTTTETKVQGQNKQGTRKTTTTTKAGKKGNTAGVKKTKTTTTTKRKKN